MKTKVFLILCCVFVFNTTALSLPTGFYAYIMPGNIQFQMTDPLGNTSGYDPASQTTLQNIPDTIYCLHREYENITKDNSQYTLGPDKSNSRGAMVGTYKLKIFAPNTVENFTFGFNVSYQNMVGHQIDIIYHAILYPNSVWTYELTIPVVPPANKQIILTKISTPADLIKDITTAGQLGYIGNPKFVTELTKEINEIEAEKAKGKVDGGLTPAQKGKKEYQELLKEITEKYNKPEADEFIKKEAYDVLTEDLEYIISHIQ